MFNLGKSVVFGAVMAMLSACNHNDENAQQYADTIYFNGQIETMDQTLGQQQALAVKDGRIFALGSNDAIDQWQQDSTRVIDLQGKTMLPGFIDAHGHMSMVANNLNYANIYPSPIGRGDSIALVVQEMQQFWDGKALSEGQWLIGYGYDDSLLLEQAHPTRQDLDQVSNTHPVLIIHVSGHMVVANSKALELAGIDANSVAPEGGTIGREVGSEQPNGLLQETAMYPVFMKLFADAPESRFEDIVELYTLTQQYYASFGITTVQEGAASVDNVKLYQQLAAQNALFLDVYAYPVWDSFDALEAEGHHPSADYQQNFRIAGIKMILDGSPQGRTAYMTEAYLTPPAGEDHSYHGFPSMDMEKASQKMGEYIKKDYQFIIHTNGDAAVEMMLDGIAANLAEGQSIRQLRPVSIHSQTTRDDQLVRMADLGVIPSFFSAHTYFWGDWHRDVVFGETRASRISPTGSASKLGLAYTTHNDAPVVDPNILRLVYNTVNRVTRSGKILGEAQRASAYEALQSVTINAAIQAHEEQQKGSLVPGKRADLVIISNNPLTVESDKIDQIEVLQTIKDGRVVFSSASMD